MTARRQRPDAVPAENARRVAEFLNGDKRVAWINYAGFPDNPYYALAQKYLSGRACSLLTFGIAGGLEGGKKFYDALKLRYFCASA